MGFRSITGRSYGIGNHVALNDPQDLCPEGWIAFDPYTYCCYCPACWEKIVDGATEGEGEIACSHGGET